MQAVAVGWQLYAITGSALDLGLVGLVQFLPMILLTLVVGRFADRYDRRAIVSCCQVLEAGAATLLALGSAGGWLGRESMLGIVALVGAARAFEGPTMAALMPGLVPRLAIPRAAAWAISATQTAQIVGPALGGLLYLAGPGAVYGDRRRALRAGGRLHGDHSRGGRPARPRRGGACRRSSRASSSSGRRPSSWARCPSTSSRCCWAAPPRSCPSMPPTSWAPGPGDSGCCARRPRWARSSCRSSSSGIPSSAGSARASSAPCWPSAPPRWCSGSPTSLPLSFAALAVLGGADVVSMVIRSSLVQLRTPDEMRGRVSAVSSLFTGTSNQLGEFRAGLTAAYLGAVPAVLIGGLGSILVAGLWMYLFPALRGIRTLDG